MTKPTQAELAWRGIKTGKLAESLVKELLNLEEPFIEVKASRMQGFRVVIKYEQLLEWAKDNRSYCIVYYDRPDGEALEHAFDNNRISLYFLTARDLMTVISDTKPIIRQYNTHGSTDERSYCQVKVTAIARYIDMKADAAGKSLSIIELNDRVTAWGDIPEVKQEELPF